MYYLYIIRLKEGNNAEQGLWLTRRGGSGSSGDGCQWGKAGNAVWIVILKQYSVCKI